MNRHNFFFLVVACFLLFATSLAGASVANSFPFRGVNPGDPLPEIVLSDMQTGKDVHFSRFKNRPYLSVFWGADMEAKKKRSLSVFTVIKELKPFLDAKNIPVQLINVQNDSDTVIHDLLKQSGLEGPVFIDRDQGAYSKLGIFVLPSVLLVDGQGIVRAGMGYSRDLDVMIKGEVEIVLGNKTREMLNLELRPEVIEEPEDVKLARRHLNTGQVLQRRGMIEEAVREIREALKIKNDMAEAHIALGCLLIDLGQTEEANQALGKGLELTPDSFEGQLCDARLLAAEGELDDAVLDLKALLLRHGRSPDLHYVLGTIYERRGEDKLAAEEFKKAYELLFRQETLHQ